MPQLPLQNCVDMLDIQLQIINYDNEYYNEYADWKSYSSSEHLPWTNHNIRLC